MNFQAVIKIFVLLQAAVFTPFPSLNASERFGKVCVESISTRGNWNGNDTGATERSIFTVQIDDLRAIRVSTNASGVFTNLPIAEPHLVKIQLDGKPLTSFRFSFQERGNHLRLWYKEFYGTWSLSDAGAKGKCACPKPEASDKVGRADKKLSER